MQRRGGYRVQILDTIGTTEDGHSAPAKRKVITAIASANATFTATDTFTAIA